MHQTAGAFDGILVRAENVGTRSTGNFEITDSALFDAKDRVIQERVRARHFDAKFHDRCAARGDEGGLDTVRGRIDEIAFAVDLVKYLTDQVAGRDKVRAGVAEVDAHFHRSSP